MLTSYQVLVPALIFVSFFIVLRPDSNGVVHMAGTKEGVDLPDVGVLRQLCRAELASRLDSVSVIIS